MKYIIPLLLFTCSFALGQEIVVAKQAKHQNKVTYTATDFKHRTIPFRGNLIKFKRGISGIDIRFELIHTSDSAQVFIVELMKPDSSLHTNFNQIDAHKEIHQFSTYFRGDWNKGVYKFNITVKGDPKHELIFEDTFYIK